MMESHASIRIELVGLGIILCSPFATAMIEAGEDYFSSHYEDGEHVKLHIDKGDIVGFGTGSPGTFILNFFVGESPRDELESCEFKLRLGVEVRDGILCVRDLYDLLEWDPSCPDERMLKLSDGFYRLTLCSDAPSSGILGDDQRISIYLESVDSMPNLQYDGVPILCE